MAGLADPQKAAFACYKSFCWLCLCSCTALSEPPLRATGKGAGRSGSLFLVRCADRHAPEMAPRELKCTLSLVEEHAFTLSARESAQRPNLQTLEIDTPLVHRYR